MVAQVATHEVPAETMSVAKGPYQHSSVRWSWHAARPRPLSTTLVPNSGQTLPSNTGTGLLSPGSGVTANTRSFYSVHQLPAKDFMDALMQ